jgi:integrase
MKCDQLKSGVWECVADGPRDPVTGKRNQIRRRNKSKKVAKERVEAAIKELKEHGIDEKKLKHMTFEKVAWEWLSIYARGKVKESTVRLRGKEIKIILRYIAKVNITKVTSRMHQNILNDLHDNGYAFTTIEGVHITAGMVYKYAIKEKMRKDSPSIGAVIPKKLLTVEDIENNSIEDEYLEHAEIEEFLTAVSKHGMDQDIERFYLLAFSGMRSGELCSLKWTDVNFETNEIRITKTIYNPDNNMKKYKLTPPKTPAAIRTIDIDEDVIQLLKKHKIRQAKIKLGTKHNYPDYHDEGFIFSRPNGYPFIPKTVLNRMNRILKMTSIKKEATPHIFRHTHISMLTEAGIDLATIMKRVGHDDADTTMRIYTHITDTMKKDASDKVKIHFGNILDLAKNKTKVTSV